MKNKKNKGFTLAEAVITVGIVGVLGAFVMPTLINNYQKKAFAVQTRKFIVELESATERLMIEEDKKNFNKTSIFTDNEKLKTFLTSKFDAKLGNGFYQGKYKTLNGKLNSSMGDSCARSSSGAPVILKNGITLCVGKITTANPYMAVSIDVNGEKGPNIIGRDYFSFYLLNDSGKVTKPNQQTTLENCYKGTANSCINVLRQNNWKMDY